MAAAPDSKGHVGVFAGYQCSLDIGEILMSGVKRLIGNRFRRAGAKDQMVSGLQVPSGSSEVAELISLDAGSRRQVDTPEPPPVRQLDGKIVAALLGLPAAMFLPCAKQSVKVDEPVRAVQCTGESEKVRRLSIGYTWKCRPKWSDDTVLGLFSGNVGMDD